MGKKRVRKSLNSSDDSPAGTNEGSTQAAITRYLDTQQAGSEVPTRSPGVELIVSRLDGLEGRLLKENKGLAELISTEVEKIRAEIHDLYVEQDNLKKEVRSLRSEKDKMGEEICALKENFNLLNKTLNNNEQWSRRSNLKILGVKETQRAEDHIETERLTLELLNKSLGLNTTSRDIDIAHRVGKPAPNRPRPILVKCIDRKTKIDIIKNRSKLKGTKILIVEDLTAQNMQFFTAVRELSFVVQAWTKEGVIHAKGRNGAIAKVTPTPGQTLDITLLRAQLDNAALTQRPPLSTTSTLSPRAMHTKPEESVSTVAGETTRPFRPTNDQNNSLVTSTALQLTGRPTCSEDNSTPRISHCTDSAQPSLERSDQTVNLISLNLEGRPIQERLSDLAQE